jgi:acetoin utilization deacetylase AcuC-like enzyme/formylglycine-generating enzyme required for sulfatase activity
VRRRAALVLLLLGCEKVDASRPAGVAPPIVKTPSGIEMVLLPAGEFEMGSALGREDEKPPHRVKVDAFLIDRTEVTQEQYERLKLPNPSKLKGPALPVHMMSWVLAARYCNERSRAEGLEPCYSEETAECDFSKPGYRLPTEAEWEYACRGGSGGSGSVKDSAWFSENSLDRLQPVARKAANAWGLHDTLGNVAEWCNDVYGKDYYGKSAAENPRGPEDGKQYVVRGGSFKSSAETLKPWRRGFDNPGFSDACLAPETLGLRCVRKVPASAAEHRNGQDELPTGFLYDEVYLKHNTGPGFPERPARIEVMAKRLEEKGLTAKISRFKAVPAPIEWIHEMHAAAYVDRVRKTCEALGKDEVVHIDTGDMPVGRQSYEAAVNAVGGVLQVVDAVTEGKIRNAFCAVRPPGHHALREKAMGFCLFNNVAIAARYVQKKHKLARVLIVDWDVHHGNATQDAFYEDGMVMYFSTHLHPFYPGSGKEDERGKGKGEGWIVNVPLPAGAGDDEVLKAYEEKLKPAADRFKPDFVFVSCGFDSHVNDTLGRLAITSEGFGKMTRVVKEIAAKHAKGRLVSMLEGGYNLENLANAAEVHVRALME